MPGSNPLQSLAANCGTSCLSLAPAPTLQKDCAITLDQSAVFRWVEPYCIRRGRTAANRLVIQGFCEAPAIPRKSGVYLTVAKQNRKFRKRRTFVQLTASKWNMSSAALAAFEPAEKAGLPPGGPPPLPPTSPPNPHPIPGPDPLPPGGPGPMPDPAPPPLPSPVPA